MRKHYLLWMILLLSVFKLNAQTYCIPAAGSSNQANYLKNAVFSDQGAFYYDADSYQAYVDNTAKVVTSYPGGTVNVHMEPSTSGSKSYVWIDWNNDGDFDDFYEDPIGPSSYTIVDDIFYVPPTQAPGIYRIRIATGSSIAAPGNPCGSNNSGNFVDFSLKIEANPTCFVPSALTSSNITNSSAAIFWTAPTSAPSIGYEYYYSSSHIVPDASTPATGTSTALSVPVSGLNSFTTYYYYVRSVCGTSDKSAWSLRKTFKTKCDPQTYMFEDFETATTGTGYILNCWDKIISGTGYQAINTASGVNNSKAMYQSASSTANTVIAVLPAFSNVNAGTHWLRFKARVSGTTAGVLDIGYVINDTDASSFVNIQSVNIGNSVFDGYEYSVVIPNTVPANSRLAIRHGGVPSTPVYLDNVYWEPKPTCLTPGNVVLSNITSISITAAWSAPASTPAMGYDIYYSTDSTPPTASTVPNITGITANTYLLQGLNSATTYYIWVRAKCSNTDHSSWTNITSALTLCAPIASLVENFDSYNTGFITNAPCWGKLVTGTGSVNINGTGAYSGTKHIMQRPLTGSSMAILPELSNVNAGTHSLRFRAYCSTNAGIMHIGYITDPANINSFVLIQDLHITNTSYTGASEYIVNIPNTVPATARLAILTDGANLIYYYDDLSWSPTAGLGVNEITAKHDLVVYPNPFTDVINIPGNTEVSSVTIYDTTGRKITELKAPSSSISLKNILQGTYMIKIFFKNGTSKTVKAVKK
ncbi:fibronectin type III domain-containing protein [Chryseobacterium sp.]|uniref:fibronectin type III domain-containing protein n=1 Tax=Chryseobacterium sp. TaxID=1871047 RepID=UPI0026240C3C|nr:fibronectin type III domain-containing protein [Chryseobacterium sp.]